MKHPFWECTGLMFLPCAPQTRIWIWLKVHEKMARWSQNMLPFYRGTWISMEFGSMSVRLWNQALEILRDDCVWDHLSELAQFQGPSARSYVCLYAYTYTSHFWVSDLVPRCFSLRDPPGPSVLSWALCLPPSSDIDLPIMAMFLKLYPVEADSSAVVHRIHGQKVLESILGLYCKFTLYLELYLEWLECLLSCYIC